MSHLTPPRQLPDTDADDDGSPDPDVPAADEAEQDPEPGAREPAAHDTRGGWFGWRRRFPRTARGVWVGTTVLAAVLVFVVLLVPNRLDQLTVQSFLRLPVEAIVLAAVLPVLPSRARRITAAVLGVFVGLTAVLKCLDMGFR
ncbi:sulfatase, partial [Streptomyces nigra]